MSGDPDQEYFADGMVEEIITSLSRILWLFVVARNSTFAYKGQTIDVKQVGRELGVCYVLEGSVRKSGGQVRITVQLIDAITGADLWADRFDGSIENVFELQDKVASSVAGIIEPALQAAETASSATRPTSDLTAYDLYLRALSHLYPRDKEGTVAALDLLKRAIGREPRYGPALALAAMCHEELFTSGWTNDAEAARRSGSDLARRALRVGGDDPTILVNAAAALAYFGEEIGTMMALVDCALTVNPSFARGWHVSGVLRLWAGQPDLAVEHLERSLRFSPRARVGMSYLMIGAAHFVSRRFNEAITNLLLAKQEDPTHPAPYRILASCYALMGRLDSARETIEQLRAITPAVVPIVTSYRKAEHRELFLSGLRLAAGEAT
jgi:adenylate cyclase